MVGLLCSGLRVPSRVALVTAAGHLETENRGWRETPETAFYHPLLPWGRMEPQDPAAGQTGSVVPCQPLPGHGWRAQRRANSQGFLPQRAAALLTGT